MNRDEVLAALEQVLNRDGETYKRAIQKTASHPPDLAETALYYELSNPLMEILTRQPEYRARPNLMVTNGHGALGFHPMMSAPQLVRRAFQVGAPAAVDWLAKVLATDRAEGFKVMLVRGITTERRTMLIDGVELIPFAALPASAQKSSVENPTGFHAMMMPDGVMFNKPTAALIGKGTIEPLLVQVDELISSHQLEALTNQLNEVRLCMTAFGPCAPVGSLEWFHFADPDIEAIAAGGYTWQPSELASNIPHQSVNIDAIIQPYLIRRFLALTGEVRNKLRISLERLNQAIRRRAIADKAIELAIALEVLLTDQQGENTWKVGFRAAQLAGGTVEERLKHRGTIAGLYRLRSAAMHHGVASDTIKVAGQGERQSLDVFKDAAAICASVIGATIARGQLPDWPRFEIEGL